MTAFLSELTARYRCTVSKTGQSYTHPKINHPSSIAEMGRTSDDFGRLPYACSGFVTRISRRKNPRKNCGTILLGDVTFMRYGSEEKNKKPYSPPKLTMLTSVQASKFVEDRTHRSQQEAAAFLASLRPAQRGAMHPRTKNAINSA